MKIFKDCTEDQITQSAQALIDGRLVAFPTETVYGLGADASNASAVSRVYEVKGRPKDHPLIVHISSVNQMAYWTSKIPDYALDLARTFWPGPMTLILPRSLFAKDFITGSQNSIGLRIPSHPLALKLLRKFESLGGKGIAAPSANRFGAISPTTAEAAIQELGKYLKENDLILDGDQSLVGIESTIIDCTKAVPCILRPGSITLEMIKDVINLDISQVNSDGHLRTPGMHVSHYAPNAKVVFDEKIQPGDGLIALAAVPTPAKVTRLASPNSVEEFARDLYQALRKADSLGLERISIILPKGEGLATAIRDRVVRAAASLMHL
jgi:L-threonylcarbamoyladenylate synthase